MIGSLFFFSPFEIIWSTIVLDAVQEKNPRGGEEKSHSQMFYKKRKAKVRRT